MFSDRLMAAVRRAATPALVGLDPRFSSLPEVLRRGRNESDRDAAANAFGEFCRGVIDVVAPLVPAVKPQAAFFEQLGTPGMRTLEETIRYARSRGLLVILDGKRNDIGSTAAGYADAYLGEQSAWQADALTVSPYLGDDSLRPFVDVAIQRACGLFVLVKTSNPGGGRFQDLVCDGRPLYEHVAEIVQALAQETAAGGNEYGAVGAVVGATYPEQLAELRSKMDRAWFLVPGFGAQGGGAADVAGAFDREGTGAIINNSRAIIFAHQRSPYRERFGDANWQQAVEAATRDMIDCLASETPAGKLLPSV